MYIIDIPTVVRVNIFVRSMSKVSEVDSEFTFDCYFRQSWSDPRLAYNTGPEFIIINIVKLYKIWTPFTYFLNSNIAYVSSKLNSFFLSAKIWYFLF
jgi:hypothetical protein